MIKIPKEKKKLIFDSLLVLLVLVAVADRKSTRLNSSH